MMDRKLLLVTADDFGMCHAVNDGILRAMREGIVTSTTLMAPCPWLGEAVRLTKQHQLPCGVHFTLTCEWDRLRWRPLTAGASLREKHGFLPQTIDEVAATATDEEITAELTEQIRLIRSMGVEPTHADVHMLSSDDRRTSALRLMGLIKRVATAEGLPLIRERDPSARYVYVDGHAMISSQSSQAIWDMLEGWSEPGVYHLFCHPAEASDELEHLCTTDTGGPAPWASTYRVADLAFLTDPGARRRIEDMGFELVGVREMFGKRG